MLTFMHKSQTCTHVFVPCAEAYIVPCLHLQGLLEFRMSRTRMPWSEMFIKMARIKKKFKLQDFFVTDTSLEQIFLSVTRKEASDAAAANLHHKTTHGMGTTVGI